MSKSDEVRRLIGSVGRLPREDQHRILKLVELLARAPSNMQRRAQMLLRELVDSDPESRSECIVVVDALIEHLERSVPRANGRLRALDGSRGLLPVFNREPDA